MSYLDVPGARLYYETHGSGPTMVMIAGAGGAADVFRMVTEHLAARYTVVIYDRRGFSRSRLDGPQDHGRRLATDADDVRRLIAHIGDEPAIVFGASSGAIVALTALTRHPDAVSTVIPFEPPVMRYLPDGQKWIDIFAELYEMYRRAGIGPALEAFRERTFPPSDRQVMAGAPRNDANAAHWFEHELRQYPAIELNLDTLKTYADRIVLAVGRDGHGYPVHDVTEVLGQTLGRTVVELPGGHAGCVSHPEGFARGLVTALERTGAPIPQTSPTAVGGDGQRGVAHRHAGHQEPGHGRDHQPGHNGGYHATHSPGLMSAGEWDGSYAATPHWDLGRPQPAMRALADAGAIRGRVLDVGCGTGEHVLMCAALGLDATGVDLAPAALRVAEDKARERGLPAQFVLGDAQRLTDLGRSFDTVLDCGLFHIFDDDERAIYVGNVRSVLVPGGRYLMLCFSDQEPGDQGPRRVNRDDITTTFADGWRIDSLEPTTLDSPTGSAGIRGWRVAVTRI
jgi:pimeloyl-ACP methyl ester carboxylesterase/SAM-dependent methyltransferase